MTTEQALNALTCPACKATPTLTKTGRTQCVPCKTIFMFITKDMLKQPDKETP